MQKTLFGRIPDMAAVMLAMAFLPGPAVEAVRRGPARPLCPAGAA